jgi:hypothetical protein
MKKVLYFLILGIFLYACKSKEVLTTNRPPNAFTVTPTLKSDGKTIVLNWTKAKDPDGDAVTYTVVLKDTLAKNISDTTYTIANLDFNYSQTGKIIAKDSKGLTSEASFTAVTKTIIFVSIPDANFEKYLVEQKIDKDGLVNGKMDVDDAKGVKILDINSKSIKSLGGIESFVNLTKLSCNNNLITTLDISKNTVLDTLNCSINQLTILDLSKNVILKRLECAENQLTTLDISKNLNLQLLICNANQLKSLDVSKNINLQKLACSNNQLTIFDVSKNVNFTYLECSSNQLITIDVSKNIALKVFLCNSNKLISLDVSKNLALIDLWCYNNFIKYICVEDLNNSIIYKWAKDSSTPYTICK